MNQKNNNFIAAWTLVKYIKPLYMCMNTPLINLYVSFSFSSLRYWVEDTVGGDQLLALLRAKDAFNRGIEVTAQCIECEETFVHAGDVEGGGRGYDGRRRPSPGS